MGVGFMTFQWSWAASSFFRWTCSRLKKVMCVLSFLGPEGVHFFCYKVHTCSWRKKRPNSSAFQTTLEWNALIVAWIGEGLRAFGKTGDCRLIGIGVEPKSVFCSLRQMRFREISARHEPPLLLREDPLLLLASEGCRSLFHADAVPILWGW